MFKAAPFGGAKREVRKRTFLNRSTSTRPVQQNQEVGQVTVNRINTDSTSVNYAARAKKRNAYTNLRKTVPRGTITSLETGIWKFPEQVKVSTCQVTNAGPSGLDYHLMGSQYKTDVCGVCNLTRHCPGHYGITPFSKLNNSNITDDLFVDRKTTNPLFFSDIIRTLTIVCYNCSESLITEEAMISRGFNKIENTADRLTVMAARISGTTPVSCRTLKDGFACPANHKYAKKDDNGVIKRSDGIVVSIETVWTIFNNISDKTSRMLGFKEGTHPRDLITRGLLITPPSYRPPYTLDSGKPQSHFLTEHYKKIFASETSAAVNRSLQRIICKDSKDPKESSGKPNDRKETMSDLLKTKDGLMNEYQTCRLDNGARSVVGGEVDLRADECIISQFFSKKLSVGEKVADFNIERLSDMVRDGRVDRITDKNGFMRRSNPKIKIEVGMTVHRNLVDGDATIYTRQPILTKTSVVCLKVKIAASKRDITTAISLNITPATNTDFDGDENNHTIPQTPSAIVESLLLMSPLASNITNPINGNMLTKPVMNQTSAPYYMTDDSIIISELTYYAIMDSNPYDVNQDDLDNRCECYGVGLFSGRSIFSSLLPRDFLLTIPKSQQNEKVVIESGIIIEGRIVSSSLNSANGIAKNIIINYGEEVYTRFLHSLAVLSSKWFNEVGFTVGPKDVPAKTPEIKEKIASSIAALDKDFKELGWKIDNEKLEDARKAKQISLTQETEGIALLIAKKSMTNSNIYKMSDGGSGTKGTSANIAQLMVSAGQIYLKGELPQFETGKCTRTRCYFAPFQTNSEAIGYSANSFVEGLTISNFINYQLGGRIAIMITNGETPVHGARSKSSNNVTRHVISNNNGEKIMQDGELVSTQFSCGYDPSKLTPSRGNMLPFNIDSIQNIINCGKGWSRREGNKLCDTTWEPSTIQQDPEYTTEISKYEKAKIISVRAEQLANNHLPFIDTVYEDTAVTIAFREFDSGLLGKFIIVRDVGRDRPSSVSCC